MYTCVCVCVPANDNREKHTPATGEEIFDHITLSVERVGGPSVSSRCKQSYDIPMLGFFYMCVPMICSAPAAHILVCHSGGSSAFVKAES